MFLGLIGDIEFEKILGQYRMQDEGDHLSLGHDPSVVFLASKKKLSYFEFGCRVEDSFLLVENHLLLIVV